MSGSKELPNEKELFRLIAEGDEAAFRKLFHQYVPLLYPMMQKITRSDTVTNDIIQETFLRVWMNRDKLPGIEYPRAWILRIAYYRAFTFLRDQATRQNALNNIAAAKNGVTDLQNDTEERMSYRNLSALVKEAIRQLPAQQKKVYQLSREKGYKTVEIARQMNLSEQSVKNTLGRALKFIRGYLEQSGYWLFVIFWIIFYRNRY